MLRPGLTFLAESLPPITSHSQQLKAKKQDCGRPGDPGFHCTNKVRIKNGRAIGRMVMT